MIGLPMSDLVPAAMAYGVGDIRAGEADIGERAVVERHQLVHGAASVAPGFEPGERSLDERRQQRSDGHFPSARSMERDQSSPSLQSSLSHRGISLIRVGARQRG